MRRSRELDVLAAIGAGGVIGALGRYELGQTWPAPPGHFPWATFVINTSGAFLLGLILTLMLKSASPTRYLRAFLCVGVLGAWTTMSTLAVEADLLVRAGSSATAAGYVLATVVVGLAVAWLGIASARHVALSRARWLSR